jgi:hypothetical protein
MAKTPSDKLFKFIRSLTPAEKRYFRIFVRGKTDRDSKYLQLFDLIDGMEAFDDDVLKSRIYHNQAIESKKYSELKAYLYELILKCLQSYDEHQSIDYRLNQLLQSVAVLYKRGHYNDCREQLHKVARLAQHYESFTHQLEVIRWEKHLAYTEMDVDFLHKKLEQLHLEERRTHEQLSNLATYRRVFFQVYASTKKDAQSRGEDRLTQLKNILEQTGFDHPDKASSHKSRVYYYRTLNIYYYATLDYQRFYESGHTLIQLLESQPHFLKESLSDYIAGLSNLILSCGLLEKYTEVRACLLKLHALSPITEDDRRKIHRQYYSNMFALCTFSGDFVNARQEMERCQEEVAHFDPHDYETASFYGQYCYICFGCGDYNAALDHLNQWFSRSRTVEREDLQSLARILSLIIHFEMGNTMLMESLVRSTTRFMQKKNRLFELERRFIQFVSELLRLPEGKEQKEAFIKMKADLKTQALQPGVKSLLQAFDLESWLDSKMSKKSFAEVVKEKFDLRQASK